LFNEDLNQHYHSTFGAIQESKHIFIETGFMHAMEKIAPRIVSGSPVMKILEIGFGTGLNALMTIAAAEKHGIRVHYTAIEAFPLEIQCWGALNYPRLLRSRHNTKHFAKLHHAPWDETVEISTNFTLQKIQCTAENYIPAAGVFDLVYFDAFGPDAQPELWTRQIFLNLGNGLLTGGSLVTYSVKGTVVRALREAGFQVEKLPGPPGKRHILRAVKIGGQLF